MIRVEVQLEVMIKVEMVMLEAIIKLEKIRLRNLFLLIYSSSFFS